MDEPEDEIIKRVARQLYGETIVLLPETLEIAKALYRKFMAGEREDAA